MKLLDVRLKIWNYTLPGQSLILDRASAAVLYDFPEQPVRARDFDKWSIHPVVLRVCHESRQEALQIYSVLLSKIEQSFMSTMSSGAPSVIESRRYGRQWINYNTDTLLLPHMKLFEIKSLPREIDCEKVRSLMLMRDRLFVLLHSGPDAQYSTRHGTDIEFYETVMSKFPNLKEFFMCINWKEKCDVPQGEALHFSNKVPLNLTAVCSDEYKLLAADHEIDEAADFEDSLKLREWIYCSKAHFQEMKEEFPECKWELKFAGGPVVFGHRKYDCGCCDEFDPLRILDFVPSRPCLRARERAYLRATSAK